MAKPAPLEPLDKMAVPDPQALLDPEVSLVSWDSRGQRESMVNLESLEREVLLDLLVLLVPLAKMVTLVLLVPQALLDLLEREENRDLVVPLASRACLDPKVSLERPASLVSRVCPVRLGGLGHLELEAIEVSLVSVASMVLPVPPEPVVLPVLLAMMVQRVRLVLLVPPAE